MRRHPGCVTGYAVILLLLAVYLLWIGVRVEWTAITFAALVTGPGFLILLTRALLVQRVWAWAVIVAVHATAALILLFALVSQISSPAGRNIPYIALALLLQIMIGGWFWGNRHVFAGSNDPANISQRRTALMWIAAAFPLLIIFFLGVVVLVGPYIVD